jgi:ubiquinone biosynthesis protein
MKAVVAPEARLARRRRSIGGGAAARAAAPLAFERDVAHTIGPRAKTARPTAGRPTARRYRQITSILARHSLGFLVGSLSSHAPGVLLHPHSESPANGRAHLTRPEHVRKAIEELGPTFIKLGQILSTRGDLLPPAYLDELEKLQDSAPPIPSEQVRGVLAEEFGRPVDELFASFDSQPLAAASIGQVHCATLLDGSEVVVKVRRPGVEEQVELDLHILLDLALRAGRHWSAARFYDLYAIAQEFAQTLRSELDYLHEAENADRFAQNFADDPDIHIPRVYWERTTARVLTLERIRGMKFTDLRAIKAARLDRRDIARRAARALLKMILDDGFFHADPHAGNLFVEADGTIALVDFGMVGRVEGPTQDLLVRLVLCMASNDASRLADVLLSISTAHVHVDRNALKRDLQHILERYLNRPLGDVKLSAFLSELLAVVRWHHLRLPTNLALLIKTLGMDEGLGVALDPHFDMMEVYVPYVEAFVRRQFSPRAWLKHFALFGLDSLQMGLEVPQQLHRILGDIERGGFEVNVQPESFEPYLARLEVLANRIVLGILVAAFTVGMALLVAAYHPNGFSGFANVLFLLVLVLSGSFGTYLLALILLSKRRTR